MSRRILAAAMLALLCAGSPAQVKHLALVKDRSSMTYHMVHPLHKFDATSNDVNYACEADPATHAITHVSGWVDVTTFDSGNSNRDSHAMEVIDAIDYPDAKFEGTGFTQKGDSLYIAGNITFHGVTRDVMAAALTHWSADTLQVDGRFDLSLTEFKIDRPTLLMMPVEDKLAFTFTAVFSF